MSVVSRQVTCAVCGGPLGGEVELEFLVDDQIRMIAVHPGHSSRPVRTRRVGQESRSLPKAV